MNNKINISMSKSELVNEILKYEKARTQKQLMRLPIEILSGQLINYRKYNK